MELFATMDDYYMDSYSLLTSNLDKYLDLSQSEIIKIDGNYHSPSQRRNAYLDLYATGHPCPSWRQIVEVLRGVDLHHQADVVESTYVQGTL